MSPALPLSPSPSRTESLIQEVYNELAGSLSYLRDFLKTDEWPNGTLAACDFRDRPLTPWVFGSYAFIAQHASRGELDAARQVFNALVRELERAPLGRFIPMADQRLPQRHWEMVGELLDSDPGRPFTPGAPEPDEFSQCYEELQAAQDLLASLDAEMAAEVEHLTPLMILAAPGVSDQGRRFGGASTFFLWGAVTLNAQIRRNPLAGIETLVHESSHQLLFGLAHGGALSENDPNSRYTSPLRPDPRPIEGIFHATFVEARLHVALSRLQESPQLPGEHIDAIQTQLAAHESAVNQGLGVLEESLLPTPHGKDVLDAMLDYQSQALRADA
ncbi:MAG: HEXXH motif-containing putative peptide modification protein [Pseudomonadota bacterium]